MKTRIILRDGLYYPEFETVIQSVYFFGLIKTKPKRVWQPTGYEYGYNYKSVKKYHKFSHAKKELEKFCKKVKYYKKRQAEYKAYQPQTFTCKDFQKETYESFNYNI